MFLKRRIYLDYASSTPVDKRVFSAMKPYFSASFHNPSAIYKEGVVARKAVDNARATIAKILNAQASQIFFMGSGTESVNLAIHGVVNAYRKNNPGKMPHIITSKIEHAAVLELCRKLEMEALASVTYLNVNKDGLVSPQDVSNAINENTILVSVMYANNEIGTIQPIKEIARRVKLWKLDNKKEVEMYPFVHTDASQAANHCSLDREKLGLDMMTLDGQKIYGPKGVGVLYVKKYISISPVIFGGGQESGLRSGTENVPAIVGMAKALEITQKIKEKESLRLEKLRNYFFTELPKFLPQALINGSLENRLPNNINFCIPGVDTEFLVLELDARGISCAFVSACENRNDLLESYVVTSLPERETCGRSSIRLSLGRGTKKTHLQKVLKLLPELCAKAKL